MKRLRDPRIYFVRQPPFIIFRYQAVQKQTLREAIGDVYLTLDILDTECIVGDLCIIDKCGA